MCFHTSAFQKTKKIEAHFKVKISAESLIPIFDQPQYHLNGFSHPNMLIIPQERRDVLAPGVWGMVPTNNKAHEIQDYYKEAVKYGGGLNAQSEKLFNHYLYRESAMARRCIIPVSGFFEPHEHLKKKYPFFIQGKDRQPLALAGLYSVIETYITFTILTKKATPLFESIHNLKKRQPLILSVDQAHHWLSQDLNVQDLKELVNSDFPEDQLEAYTVSKDLFNPKVDSNTENILEKVDYQELSHLNEPFTSQD